MARSFTVTQSTDSRDFSISQEGFSRSFAVETGVGPIGPTGPGGGDLTSYVDQVAALPDYPETFPNSAVTAATSAATANTIVKRDASGNASFSIVNSEGVSTGSVDVTSSMAYGADATFSYTAGTSRANHLTALGALPAADGTATNLTLSTPSLTLSAGATVTCADAAAALALRNAAGLGTTNTLTVANVIVDDGSEAAPAIKFSAHPTYGFCYASSGVGIVVNGSIRFLHTFAGALKLRSDGVIAATATTNPANAADTGLSRTAPATWAIGNGTAGNATGTLELAQINLGKTITVAATTGAQTINKSSGSINFAAAATSLVVTNSLVTANSVIQCTVATADTTMFSAQAVAGTGSFTIYPNAAPAAETRVNFTLTN